MTDKELIERLALEAARPYGSNSIQSADHIIAFAIRFLVRYLEERGKEAVYQIRTRSPDNRFFGDWVECAKEDAEKYADDRYCEMRTLFLAPPPIPEGMEQLVNLIKDDAYAMTFQSLGQYRSALIKAAVAGVKP